MPSNNNESKHDNESKGSHGESQSTCYNRFGPYTPPLTQLAISGFVLGIMLAPDKILILESVKTLKLELMKQPSMWFPSLFAMFTNGMSGMFQAYNENHRTHQTERAQQVAELRNTMMVYLHEGHQAMQERNYHLALQKFIGARKLHESLYPSHNYTSNIGHEEFHRHMRLHTELEYLKYIFRESQALYQLKMFEEAKSRISNVLEHSKFKDTEYTEIACLLNLRGLIYFHDGWLTEDQKEQEGLWKEAKGDFNKSIKIDDTQQDIFLLIQYINKNVQYLVKNIPNYLFNPSFDYSISNTDVNKGQIFTIYADVFLTKKEWPKAIFLYEDCQKGILHNPRNFLELAKLNMKCLEAYNGLVEDIIEWPNHEEKSIGQPHHNNRITTEADNLFLLKREPNRERLVKEKASYAELKRRVTEKIEITELYFDEEKKLTDDANFLNLKSTLNTTLGNLQNRENTLPYSNRLSVKEHRTGELQTVMLSNQQEGDKAMEEKKYLLALRNYSNSSAIYYTLFADKMHNVQEYSPEHRKHVKSVYIEYIYNESLALYHLNRFKDAVNKLNEILNDSKYNAVIFDGKNSALNLRGLIYFHDGWLTEDQKEQDELWNEAISDFNKSYQIDKTQNDIFFFLQYLNEEYQFLVDNIPHHPFNPNVNLSTNISDEMVVVITRICADACLKEKLWGKAILLYEYCLNDIIYNPSNFFEISKINIQCLVCYSGLLEEFIKNENLHNLIVLKDSSDCTTLEEEIVSCVEIRQIVIKKIQVANSLLNIVSDKNNGTYVTLTERLSEVDKVLHERLSRIENSESTQISDEEKSHDVSNTGLFNENTRRRSNTQNSQGDETRNSIPDVNQQKKKEIDKLSVKVDKLEKKLEKCDNAIKLSFFDRNDLKPIIRQVNEINKSEISQGDETLVRKITENFRRVIEKFHIRKQQLEQASSASGINSNGMFSAGTRSSLMETSGRDLNDKSINDSLKCGNCS